METQGNLEGHLVAIFSIPWSTQGKAFPCASPGMASYGSVITSVPLIAESRTPSSLRYHTYQWWTGWATSIQIKIVLGGGHIKSQADVISDLERRENHTERRSF